MYEVRSMLFCCVKILNYKNVHKDIPPNFWKKHLQKSSLIFITSINKNNYLNFIHEGIEYDCKKIITKLCQVMEFNVKEIRDKKYKIDKDLVNILSEPTIINLRHIIQLKFKQMKDTFQEYCDKLIRFDKTGNFRIFRCNKSKFYNYVFDDCEWYKRKISKPKFTIFEFYTDNGSIVKNIKVDIIEEHRILLVFRPPVNL